MAGQLDEDWEKRRRRRSIAIAIALALLAILFFVVTIVRLGGSVVNRSL